MNAPSPRLAAMLSLSLTVIGARADFNINDAFVANEKGAGTLTFPGPLGGILRVGYNVTPANSATFRTTGLVHSDSWAGSASLQGWYYPNSAIVPAMIVNPTTAAVNTGFAITGPGQIHLHPGNPSANAGTQPASAAVVSYTSAVSGIHTISGSFDSLNGGTVAVDVLLNGVSMLSNGSGSDATAFLEVVTLAVGDRIDFVVDDAGDIGSDSTGLYANIAPGAPPVEPVDLSLNKPEPIGPATRRGPFVFSEIMYHPAAREDGKNTKFIEIYNSQPWAEELTDYRLTGDVNFDFPAGTTIPALGRIVVAEAPEDVRSAYGITGVLGPWEGQLNVGGGTVRLRNEGDGIAFEADYDSEHAWPAAPDGGGPALVLARPSFGMLDPRAWAAGAVAGGSPGAAEPESANPQAGVVFNEVLAGSGELDFIELHNIATEPVDVAGCVITDAPDAPKFAFPAAAIIPGGGFLSVTAAQLGFAPPAEGGTLYLRSPDGTRVLDAVRFGALESGVSSGRTPDGAPGWTRLAGLTSGAANSFARRAEVVISEIMYHPIHDSSDGEYVELHNRGGAPVDLGGWRLRGEADFDIPAGTTLAADARLVIAKSPATLIPAYAALNAANTLGPFSGSLSNRAGRIALQAPVTVTPQAGFPVTLPAEVDAVEYGTGGRWGKWSDGGGSSLELIDPRADSRLAPAWADSDESAKSGWKTIEVTGVLDHGMGAAPANQIQLFLQGEGECLVDDVEVVPNGGANRVGNGTFATSTGWTFQGTQETSTISDGALNLRASDRGDTSNRVFANLTGALNTGTTATLRARVKWLRGSPDFLMRLRGGWLEAGGNILTASAFGTPGAPNSRAVANAAPAITEVTHRPMLPGFNQAVTVFARVSDPDGPAAVSLQYRLDPATTLTTVEMTRDSAGWYRATIPAQAPGKLAAFRVSAADSIGAGSLFPTDAPARECLVRWGDSKTAGSLGAYRMWMTQATRDRWASREKNSNTALDITFLYGDSRAIYNAGAKYSGSWAHTPGFSSPVGAPCDYTLDFPDDDRLLGENGAVVALPGTVGDDPTFQREQLIWWMGRKLRIPSLHRRFVRVFVNGQQRQQVFEDTQQPGNEFLAEWFPNDDEGRLHKSQDWVEFQDNGMSALGDLRATLGNFTTTGGAKKTARYRYLWAPRGGGGPNDFADFFALVDAHNLPLASGYEARIKSLVDVNSWMRGMALQRIAGNWDSYGWSIGKNMYAYKPRLGRWAMIPWDIDFSFAQTGDSATSNLFTNTSEHIGNESMADPLMTKFRNNVTFRREYWRAFSDAAKGSMAVANARIDLVHNGLISEGLSPSGLETVKTYTANRRTYILSQLATVSANFAVTGPTEFSTAESTLTLSGTAPVDTATIVVNGLALSPAWTSVTAWNAAYLLAPGVNNLVIQAFDGAGRLLGTTTLAVTHTGTASWPALRINEWMASNDSFVDPADGDADDWLEIHNPTAASVDLTDWRLSDNPANLVKFIMPAGYSIPPGGHLLVWTDSEADQNTAGNPQPHTNFKISAAGGSLLLSAPDGTLVDAVTFGAQEKNLAEGRYPDGAENPRALTLPTPGRPNALTRFTAFTKTGATVNLTFTTTPGLRYRIETSADLLEWAPAAIEQTATGGTLSVTAPATGPEKTFYRAVVSD